MLAALKNLKEKVKEHQKSIKEELDKHLATTREKVVSYYVPLAMNAPSQKLQDGVPNVEDEADVRWWVEKQLDPKFPTADSLFSKIELVWHFKDLTFDTLKQDTDFRDKIEKAYPDKDWGKVYDAFRAAGEADT